MNTDTDNYFGDYENLEIHDIMLKDRARQEKYREAIFKHKEYFKDKIVLDVGAGTGILSCFCAQAGAKKVLAVEPTNVAHIAREVIKENDLESKIEVFQTTIEKFQLPKPIEAVDIIISEWMGFYLLHEGMLDSVIFARKHFLRENGLMFPSVAMLSIAPCSIPGLYKYYDDVDGVKMTSFARKLREQKASKPEIRYVEDVELLHTGNVFFYANLMEVELEDLEKIEFNETQVVQKAGRFEGFCIWWEVQFQTEDPENDVILCTGPDDPKTHWKQCVIVMPESACEEVVVDQPVSFNVTVKRNETNSRRYNIELELKDAECVPHQPPCSCYLTRCILAKAHLEKLEKIPAASLADEGMKDADKSLAIKDKRPDDLPSPHKKNRIDKTEDMDE